MNNICQIITLSAIICAAFLKTVHAQEAPAPDQKIEFSADKVVYDQKLDVITASGKVILNQNGNTLTADNIVYEVKSGQVSAHGGITILEASGNIMHMEDAELEGDLKKGFINNTRVIFVDGSKLIARSGERDGQKTILKNAIYTPCEICVVEGEGKDKPTWQIKANEVIHDSDNKTIKYKNVKLELAGIPILYSPYFSHPDPTVRSRTGLLPPARLGRSTELGVFVQVPYFFDISQNKDFTFEPIITSREGVVFGGTYRQHTGNGMFSTSGSIANVNERDNNFEKTGDHELRGHIFSEGAFDINSLDNLGGDWQWDYAAKWVSDDTYLRRYYDDKSDVLESHAKVERFWDKNYATVGTYLFQGLDEEDNYNLTGQAMPSFALNMNEDAGFLNSKFTLDASGVQIHRIEGMRSRRMSAKAGWELPFQSSMGDFYTISASVRSDVYHNSNSQFPDLPQYAGVDGTHNRVLPKLALDWRMPFLKSTASTSQVLEPMFSIIVAPTKPNLPENVINFSNEDSRNFEFDENNLFSHNRFNGYDRWEGGTRLNMGIRYNMYTDNINLTATIGQSVRLNNTETFPIGSGYEGKASDLVGRVDLTLGEYVDYIHRFRLDKKSLDLRRNEMIISGGPKWIKASIRYLDLDLERDDNRLIGTELENRREIGTGLNVFLDDKWSVQGTWVKDILNNKTVSYDAGIVYKDGCLEFGLSYERRFTSDRDIAPSNTVHFRLVLKNLG
ncbi:MAG: LPS-assembly protein LptD [Kordiimonadaceae bacterium]|jgi:LPS-assembly protein|nr:LPS-assembly protein LptD [Kordiimonadaceae bacterium]